MPRRTNPFQRVIATVYRHLSDEPIQESKMVADPAAGIDREVDVVVTETVVGEEINVGVEATAPGRKLDLTKLDSLIKKHEDIGSHYLIIVSKSGFTEPAQRKIDATPNVSGYQPKDLSDKIQLETRIVGRLAALWQKRFSVTLTDVFAEIELPASLRDTNIAQWVFPPPSFPLLHAEGNEAATPEGLFLEWAQGNGEEIATLLGVTDVAEDTEKTLLKDLLPPWRLDGKELGDLYVPVNTNLNVGPPTLELLKLLKLDLRGPATIGVSKFDLQHQQLNKNVAYSVGETAVDGRPVLLVVSASRKGEKITTLPLEQAKVSAKAAKRKRPKTAKRTKRPKGR